jgi:hypothetical protein
MKLLTKALRKELPALYSQENNPDPKVVVKFFTPWTNWTWYATEGEPILDDDGNEVDFRFFGLVDGQEKELGYFSLNEMSSIMGPWGLKIERDMHFDDHSLSEFRK